jgi:hypothetical protein
MTRAATTQSDAMTRNGAVDPRRDDAEQGDDEERRP